MYIYYFHKKYKHAFEKLKVFVKMNIDSCKEESNQ